MWPPVTRFAVSFTAGLWTGVFFSAPATPIVIVAIVVVASGSALGWRHRLVGSFLVGVGAGSVAALQHHTSCAEQWGPGRYAAVVRVHDAPGARRTTTAAVLHTPVGCEGDLRLSLDSGAVVGGATAVVVGSVRVNGWFRVEHLRPLPGHERPWRFRIRGAVGQRIRRLFGPRAPLVEAMVLGRRSDLDPAVRDQFVGGGLAHLLAISGLHVGIIVGWLRLLVRWVGGARAGWVIGACFGWAYVALLGFPAPATRAATFIAIGTLARLRERRPPATAVISVAALVVLAIDPQAVRSVGAWLSVAAVVGTTAAGHALERAGRDGTMARLLAVSVGATLATAPITAYAFGNVAPIGVVANLVGVPLAGMAVPAIFAALLGGEIIAGGAGLALAGLEQVASLAGRVPWGHLDGEPSARFALPWTCLAMLATWIVWRRPTWSIVWRRAGLVAATTSWTIAARPVRSDHDGRLAIYVLAVGQGDAIAIRTPRGRWLLIDGGPRLGTADAGQRVVLPFLRAHGARRLDAVFVSHGDADHLGGLPSVIAQSDPAMVVEPGQPLGTALYREYLGTVDASGGRWRVGRAGDTLEIDSVTVAVLHPSAAWMASQISVNENSLILHLRYGEFDALFTGDAGWPAESALAATVPTAELLKVGHHGSAGSTSRTLLDSVRPRAAVISVGSNRFGHPTGIVLDRLQERGIAVYRTDEAGTVTIQTNGDYFEITHGRSISLMERIRCLSPMSSLSNGSSSSRSGCIRTQPASSRTFSTISR